MKRAFRVSGWVVTALLTLVVVGMFARVAYCYLAPYRSACMVIDDFD
jgi:hypothetical protein